MGPIHINNFNVYQDLAGMTNSTKEAEPRLQLLHTYMGFVGEVSEIIEQLTKISPNPEDFSDIVPTLFDKQSVEAIMSEVGDVLWYLATGHIALVNCFNEYNQRVMEEGGSVLELPKALESFDKLVHMAKPESVEEYFKDITTMLAGSTLTLLPELGLALDTVKKIYVYKQPIKEQWLLGFAVDFINLMSLVKGSVMFYKTYYNSDFCLKTLAEANILKLRARFGDKFTVTASANRNYDFESEASKLTVR